jgi:hypothetical protein
MEIPSKTDQALALALSRAESLAFDFPAGHAVIYQSSRNGGYHVQPWDAEPPAESTVFTTVSRKPGTNVHGVQLKREIRTLGEAVRYVLSNMPAGVELHPQAMVRHFPVEPGALSHRPAEVFSYAFMSAEGLNVATWLPTNSLSQHVQMHLGPLGRGRVTAHFDAASKVDVTREIDAALVQSLPAGDCSSEYQAGWERAEGFLQGGGDVYADGPSGGEAHFNGFVARLGVERSIRMERDMKRDIARSGFEAAMDPRGKRPKIHA